jgi:hypothetical protein
LVFVASQLITQLKVKEQRLVDSESGYKVEENDHNLNAQGNTSDS